MIQPGINTLKELQKKNEYRTAPVSMEITCRNGHMKLGEETSPSAACEINHGEFKSYTISPEEFHLTPCKKEDLMGGTPEENAAITLAILNGEKAPKRNAFLLNTGAALYLGGRAERIAEYAGKRVTEAKKRFPLKKLLTLFPYPAFEKILS